jgi:uncharacterized Fe-S radical SAM superfamily protein PflX
MAQYRPAGKVSSKNYSEINRPLGSPDYKTAVQMAQQAGLRLDERRWRGWSFFTQ